MNNYFITLDDAIELLFVCSNRRRFYSEGGKPSL